MYLDPLFGSMVVQVIVVAVACGGAVLFSIRKKLRRLFSKKKSVQPANPSGSISANLTDSTPKKEAE